MMTLYSTTQYCNTFWQLQVLATNNAVKVGLRRPMLKYLADVIMVNLLQSMQSTVLLLLSLLSAAAAQEVRLPMQL